MQPTFQRKQYQQIAAVINKMQWPQSIAGSFITMFKADNPRFDESKFLRACTVVDFKEEK